MLQKKFKKIEIKDSRCSKKCVNLINADERKIIF
jgi:hypothetical protein